MAKTVALVTSQYKCDRIIHAARVAAERTGTELVVTGVLDSEYELNPQAIEYLFELSKQSGATMGLMFTEDKLSAICNMISQHDCQNIVTGMPASNKSVVYDLWKLYPRKSFFTADTTGELIEVAKSTYCTA